MHNHDVRLNSASNCTVSTHFILSHTFLTTIYVKNKQYVLQKYNSNTDKFNKTQKFT